MKYQFKIIIGNLKKSSLTSFLNLVGLTSAFAAFILIILYVWNEYHFDQYQENSGQIYRLEYKSPKRDKASVFMLGPTGETLVNEFPEIIKTTTYMPWGKWGEQPFSYENKTGIQRSYEDYAFSDENITDIFSFRFISGKQKPLEEPATAIVTKSFAQKAWGNNNPLGKQLNVTGTSYTVTGVYEDLPENSVITCPIILKIPTEGFIAEARTKWDVTNYPQFILTEPGVDTKELNQKINEQSILKSKYRFFDNGKTAATIIVRPLGDLRFTQEVAENPMFTSNNKLFVDSLLVVGILILAVALINYINFSTATLPKRMKTFNINRVIGGGKWNSAVQLMLETLMVFLVSLIFAFLLAYTLNKSFSTSVLGYELPFTQNLYVLGLTAGITLVAVFIAAVYPAVVSTKGNYIESLKTTGTGMSESFRGSLTVFQFAATIALIVASATVLKQVKFMEKSNLGFDKGNTLVIRIYDEIRKNYPAFRQELEASSVVDQVACSRAVPGQAQEYNIFNVDGEACFAWNWAVGDDYMEMMGFEIVDGRGFLNNSEAEKGNFICNETAAKRYGWKVGTKINDKQIVGIMKDFNMVSLRENIDPFVFHKAGSIDELGVVSLKFNKKNSQAVLASVKNIFEEFCPEIPFRGFFLDDQLNMLYAKETQQSKLITFFSLLSVIVSMLGILGLSIFLCQQKIKEIGIRKVNGAKISEIMLMLNKSFIKWVAISLLIAFPSAYFTMHKWLDNFAYKTLLSWWIFALAGLLALGIALLTVSWQSWRAATKNPVEALRYE
ncbi:ABC transporter permease [Maribellus maritimus]|uniref:ABC transporter permease n=1 Tax=Maribellus maritimus TaxID=2870838 RepID=UPI001EEC3372|nr:ABC transporter permease [Maribellus maritimus]MCG6189912.1 ABC transporter permease [Maribellus maritimus]